MFVSPVFRKNFFEKLAFLNWELQELFDNLVVRENCPTLNVEEVAMKVLDVQDILKVGMKRIGNLGCNVYKWECKHKGLVSEATNILLKRLKRPNF